MPRAATGVVFSAHGVAPSVHVNAAKLQLNTIDATPPLVTKVHVQARRYAADGYTVILIGHAGHEEVVGTMGEAPDKIVLVESAEDVARLDFPADKRLAYITQTTLSVDETAEVITALRNRFPTIYAPKKEDICYATSNRQWAVKEMLAEIELLLVIGSHNSSNSNRLVEVARAAVESYLIDDASEIDEAGRGVEVVGITAALGAGEAVTDVCDWLRERGVTISSRTGSSAKTSSSACRSSCARARARRAAELGNSIPSRRAELDGPASRPDPVAAGGDQVPQSGSHGAGCGR